MSEQHYYDKCWYPVELNGNMNPCAVERHEHDWAEGEHEFTDFVEPPSEPAAQAVCDVASRPCGRFNDECTTHSDVIGELTFESQFQHGKFQPATEAEEPTDD